MREICRRPIRRSTKSGRVLTGIRKGRRSKRLRASNAGPRCRTGGEIRSAVREKAGQGGAQSTQARQRPRHLPQDAARGAAYSRRTAAKDTRALHSSTAASLHTRTDSQAGNRRGRKQYAIPQNKNAPRSKHESPCAPPKLKECLPHDA